MFQWLGRFRFRRIVLCLVLLSYIPVVSAAVACQIACAMQVQPHASAHERGHADDRPDAARAKAHLAHAGACTLASLPTMCTADFRLVDFSTASRLEPTAITRPASCIWPPPEHKPRT